MLHNKDTFEDISKIHLYWKNNMDKIVNYFMNIKDKVNLEKLRFY